MSNKRRRYIYLSILLVLIVMQFIRPGANDGQARGAFDITNSFHVSDTVLAVLDKACFDCHSDQTRYPWYASVQPVYWWLNNHVSEGKAALNFSIFNRYKLKKQISKMEDVIELLSKEEMPLASYTWMHSNARLTALERAELIRWAQEKKAELESR